MNPCPPLTVGIGSIYREYRYYVKVKKFVVYPQTLLATNVKTIGIGFIYRGRHYVRCHLFAYTEIEFDHQDIEEEVEEGSTYEHVKHTYDY
jgi:hypothetical protein